MGTCLRAKIAALSKGWAIETKLNKQKKARAVKGFNTFGNDFTQVKIGYFLFDIKGFFQAKLEFWG